MVNLPLSKVVKDAGNYLYKNIKSASKIRSEGNNFYVYFTITFSAASSFLDSFDYEQLPAYVNVTTYADKLRINIIERSRSEKTIGSFTITPAKFDTVGSLNKALLDKVVKKILSAYYPYNISF